MRLDDILAKIDKGEPVDWAGIARRQPLELLKTSQDYQREAEERSRLADEVMQRMIDNVRIPEEPERPS